MPICEGRNLSLVKNPNPQAIMPPPPPAPRHLHIVKPPQEAEVVDKQLVQRFLDMRGSPPAVVIVENPWRENPGWYIRFPSGKLHTDPPKFYNHEGAVAFCKYMGYAYTTEYYHAH